MLGNIGHGASAPGGLVPASPRSGDDSRPGGLPVRSGTVPPLADCFSARPETGPGAARSVPGPGQAMALTGPGSPPGQRHDWPGGTGKTQLAAFLAESLWRSRELDLLVWATASRRASVQFSFARALGELTGSEPGDGAGEAADRFVTWLAQADRPWLVVLDDLADPADLTGLWPAGPAGRVIVTAQDPALLPERAGATVCPVGTFSSREALTYLMGRLSADPDQRIGAVDLVDDLAGEPLALAQASATIMNSELTCRDYRILFARRWEQLAETTGAEPSAKAVTWTLSVEHSDRLTPGGRAQPCLALAGLLDSHGIPGAVFTTQAACEYIAAGRPAAPADPGRVRAALVSLERTGLLTIDAASTARSVRVHQAVQAAVRWATPDAMREQAARAAAKALVEAWPAGDAEPGLSEALRSCADSLASEAGDSLWSSGAHALLFQLGRSLDSARLTVPAIAHWRELAEVSERVLGPDHPDSVLAADRLASASLTGGLGPEAVSLYQRTLQSRADTLGPDHPSTIAVRADLGSALLAAGRIAEAVPVLEEVLNIRSRVQGPADPATLAVQDDLTAAYHEGGRYPEAIRMGRRTLLDREREQGPDHPDTIVARERLASACLAAGRAKDAVTHYTRALADRERTRGEDDPATIVTVGALADACRAARRLKDALPLYERVLRGRERVQGPDHRETLGALARLASAYHSAGRMAAALKLYERSRAECQRVLGAQHPDTLAARANLAQAYYSVGRLSDAVTLLRDVASDCERVLPAGHPLTGTVRESLGAIADD